MKFNKITAITNQYKLMFGITKTKLMGIKLTAIFYDKDKNPIKTVHFGASGFLDYTIAPHDEEQ